MPVSVRLDGDAGFAQVSRLLKQAGEGELRKAMAAEAREVAKPILKDLRSAVLALDSSAKSRGSAGAARAIASTRRRKDETDAAFAKRKAKNENAKQRKAESQEDYAKRIARSLDKGRSGSLRAAVARSLRIAARDSGPRVGVRIKTESGRMPDGQRYLGRGLDSVKGWRHPVFGTDEWVTQYGNPPGWFLSTASAHKPMAERRLRAVVDKYIRELAARLDKAA